MKKKLSISIEEETIQDLEERVSTGLFRNKSHIIEFAVSKLLKEEKDGNIK